MAAGPTAYQRVSVTTADSRFSFNVFYFKLPGGPDVEQQTLAETVAAVALEAYDAETGLLGRFPLSDDGLPCNGGDAGLDIYLVPMNNLKLAAQTIPYFGQCANGPSFIQLNLFYPVFAVGIAQPTANARSAQKGVVAHELLHVLQLAMTRQASCADTRWFDEATAEWAMDFVEPEVPVDGHRHARHRRWPRDGLHQEAAQRRVLRRVPLPLPHAIAREGGRAQPRLRRLPLLPVPGQVARPPRRSGGMLHDAMAGGNGSVESIGTAIDMTAVWPEFAKTLWNDVTTARARLLEHRGWLRFRPVRRVLRSRRPSTARPPT